MVYIEQLIETIISDLYVQKHAFVEEETINSPHNKSKCLYFYHLWTMSSYTKSYYCIINY